MCADSGNAAVSTERSNLCGERFTYNRSTGLQQRNATMSCRKAHAILLTIGLLLASTVRAAGMRELVVPADAIGPEISARLWTPCATPPGPLEVNSGGHTLIIKAVKDCTPSSKGLPLVLVSHGMFGDVFSHHDTAEVLADAGFAVVTIDHPMDFISANRESVDNLSSFLVRPVDIKRAITFMLSDLQQFVVIDARRIGFFGFSRGGYTGLVLAGAVPDFHKVPFPCPEEFFMCKQIRDNNIPEHSPGDDPRIKAFVIADPISFFPNKSSLRNATAPIQLWSSDQGGMGVRPEDVAAVAKHLPSAPEFHLANNAGHLSFQFPCSSEVAKAMSFICTDPPRFDRTEFHKTFNAQVSEFFRKKL
jgi:predicted dienelactone hydrolase